MSGATHIIGSYVFVGTLCSFSDVNIFGNPAYIYACAGFSVLPDIDTTKSLIGKLFYPVAWLINRKFGHRTITHSFLFLAFVWALMLSLVKFEFIADPNFLKIALFAVISHFVFDMITLSGIPLLFPFFKNACVIPANPNFRFKSGEWKSEIMITGICGLLCFTMQPLFAQGFWTSYNRTFGTIKHVDRENQNTEYYVVCEYSYILNAETHEGEAIVIDSKNNELTLFDRRRVFSINSDNPQIKINYAKPRISTIEKRFEELQFFNINYDSLLSILSGKLVSGLIQSNKNVRYIDNAITYHTNFIKFANRFDFHIFAMDDSSKISIKTNIAKLEAAIKQTNQKHQTELQKWQQHQRSIKNIEDTLKSQTLSNYDLNKLQQELISLRRKNYDKPVYAPPTIQIAELEAQKRALTDNPLSFSGHMTIYTFGYDYSGSGTHFVIKPIYHAENLFALLPPNH